MTSTGGETTEVTLPTHSLTIQVNGETIKNIGGIVMDSDEMVNITIPEVKMDFDKIYPIGSVYISASPGLDPNVVFAPTVWQHMADGRTLWNVRTDSSEIGSNLNGIFPNHRHSADTPKYSTCEDLYTTSAGGGYISTTTSNTGLPTLDSSVPSTITVGSNLRPPSIAVTMWKRIG